MTFVVALLMFVPFALAVTTVEPTPTPVTGTLTVVAFCAMEAVAGMETMPELLAARFTVRPPVGAGRESVMVRFCDAGPVSVTVCGVIPRAAGTITVATPD